MRLSRKMGEGQGVGGNLLSNTVLGMTELEFMEKKSRP